MPGHPAQQSQSGEGNDVCYHKLKPSVRFAIPGAAFLYRIVLLINLLLEASGNPSLESKVLLAVPNKGACI